MLIFPASPVARIHPLIRRTAKIVVLSVLGYAAVWLVATLGMLGIHALASQQGSSGVRMAGINHFQAVDDRLWRGSAPREAGYRELSARGVNTVVDLRAEKLSAAALAVPRDAGLKVVHMPIRDGQTPTTEQVDRFLRTVESASGPVFVHCGAGVGRTGAMAAAYAVRIGDATSAQAALRNLAVGPPSIEQVWYALSTGRDDDETEQPPAVVEAISRILDAPRRINASI
ncbi:dual specificity protein phosphatase family protein [Streptomyces sp. NPDC048825]|uniref:fused DSP-PTPase phosphatase/NAD kinase-like protein n=1 Tax=Streptomyces sp. NPDC048825 TaxID=3365592 RepID=UPI00370F939F